MYHTWIMHHRKKLDGGKLAKRKNGSQKRRYPDFHTHKHAEDQAKTTLRIFIIFAENGDIFDISLSRIWLSGPGIPGQASTNFELQPSTLFYTHRSQVSDSSNSVLTTNAWRCNNSSRKFQSSPRESPEIEKWARSTRQNSIPNKIPPSVLLCWKTLWQHGSIGSRRKSNKTLPSLFKNTEVFQIHGHYRLKNVMCSYT